jgi:hypothetical protein
MAASVGYLGGVPVGGPVRGTLGGEVATLLVMAMGYYGNVSAVVMRKVSAG